MNQRPAFLQDRILPEEEASVSLRDLALNRGYGVFDFFRAVNGIPLFFNDHLDRFFRSAAHLRLEVPLSRNAIRQAVRELLQQCGLPDAGIRMELTGGNAPDGFSLGQPLFFMTVTDLAATRHQRPESIGLWPVLHQRQLAEAKTIDYLMAIWLQPLLREKGADDALYHHNGLVRECPRSNVFLVTEQGILVTPDDGLLKGITREKILRVARPLLRVEERPVHLDEFCRAREVFITSTTKGVLPVHSVEGQPFPGAAGEVTSRISEAFTAYRADWIAQATD
ncbi:MAG TPA: aminotransferase class IV [Chitinophagaceae bacterium]|nr:aminotransferase class IV [Chitinophagaceae bacterium]